MRRTAFAVIAAVVLALVQVGFVTALPAPASAVRLPLILVVALITSFRMTDAYVAAVTAGLVMDSMSSLPFGSNTFILTATCAVTALLFTRVFTHHSRRGNLALHLGAFALAAATRALALMARGSFSGLPLLPERVNPWWSDAGSAMLVQLLTVVCAMLALALARRAFGRAFMLGPSPYRSHAR